MQGPDWPAVAREAAANLSQLIQFDTTNPPGHETPAARWLAGVLARDGIFAQVLESAPGRGNLVARLAAGGPLREEPLLLMSHLDVVPAEAEHWTHPPFAGLERDGQVWGRGALDMKHYVITWLTLLQQLRRTGRPIGRDIVFIATADEEAGGRLGAGWLVEHHWDLIRCAAALNEWGGHPFRLGERLYYGYQTAEKYAARFRLVARGTPGHASEPRDDNAVVRLARAVLALGETRLPVHVTPPLSDLAAALAASQPEPTRSQVLALTDPHTAPAAAQAAFAGTALQGQIMACLSNTCTPTMLEAGSKVNVIPATARCSVDCRALPGVSRAEVQAEVEAVLAARGLLGFVAVEWLSAATGSSPPSPSQHPLVDQLRSALGHHLPEAELVPVMSTGGTDGRYIRPLGVPCYGFLPLVEGAALDTVHGHDERLSVASLEFGLQVMWDAVTGYCRP